MKLFGAISTGALFLASHAGAVTITQTGMFTADNSVFTYNFTLQTASPVSFYTTSYGGGMNLDGTTSASGGFVPVLTVYSSSGNVIVSDGADGVKHGSSMRDPKTSLYDDAYISRTLAAGTYTLALTEFPNVAIGTLSSGFLFSSDPHATGNACGNASGTFLQADVAPCSQRNGSYAINISSTPEPGTLFLLFPAAAVAIFVRKRMAVQQ